MKVWMLFLMLMVSGSCSQLALAQPPLPDSRDGAIGPAILMSQATDEDGGGSEEPPLVGD